MAAEYYELLGVRPDATQDEIKKSYRQLARQLHPDANPDDPDAEAKFKEVARAYETLSDPERRRRYDMFGADTPAGGADAYGFGGGLGDLFDAFFGSTSPFRGTRQTAGPPRGADLEVSVEVEFAEAVFGTQEPVAVRTAVPCEACEATGAAPGSAPATCPDCGGAGQVRRVRQSILGQMVTAGLCGRCGGSGQVIERPCPECRGEGRTVEEKTYLVDIPPGVDTGSTLRLSGRGAVGPRGGGYGDLYVHVRVQDHERFHRQAEDLIDELHIPMTQATLGAKLSYETLDGTEDLAIPPGTQTGRVFRLRGRGVPSLSGRGRGDLLVQIFVDTPANLRPDEEELLRKLAEARGEDVAPADTGFFSRIRSAFK